LTGHTGQAMTICTGVTRYLPLPLDPKPSLRRLAYDPYGWLAGLSRGLGLLMA